MAGSIEFLYSETRTVKKVTFDWVSDASTGAVSGNLSKALSGVIERVTFVPEGGGTQPDNLYDVVLNDVEGFDVLNGKGANLSESATTSVAIALTGGQMAFDDRLDLVIANAGNSNGGKVIIYIR